MSGYVGFPLDISGYVGYSNGAGRNICPATPRNSYAAYETSTA